MTISDDVIVIGGGLAGYTTALTAARTGADVRLISANDNTLRHASGLIDVLGYRPGGAGLVLDPFDAIETLPEEHPYSIVGPDTIRSSLALFEDITGDRYHGGHTDRNALVPTPAGRVKPTARYPMGMAHGLASSTGDVLLVGFDRLTDFDAPLVATQLSALGVPFDVRGVTVEFPGLEGPEVSRTRFARLLDRNPDTMETATGIRDALIDRVFSHLDGEDRVGVPAILGIEQHTAVHRRLESGLSRRVFELPTEPPSLPGIRLEHRFRAALEDADVNLQLGNPVVEYDSVDGRIRSLLVDKGGQHHRFAANRFVLCTGGLVGKGLTGNRDAVRETIFDCYVSHPDHRYDWFDDDFFGTHSFPRFGVTVDDHLRPLTKTGEVEFTNLHAAGSVLGGFDLAAENSGSGVSLATGFVAGTRAGEAI